MADPTQTQSAATVLMLDPDGNLGEVPQEKMQDALKAGGKLAVPMKAPDGSQGFVPHDQVKQAMNAGGRVALPVPEGSPDKGIDKGFFYGLGKINTALQGTL